MNLGVKSSAPIFVSISREYKKIALKIFVFIDVHEIAINRKVTCKEYAGTERMFKFPNI